jgi:hypothetical protein
MKTRLYGDDDIPHVEDIDVYQQSWISWWMACQPPWRKDKAWPLPKERAEKATWGKLSARGRNGLFLVVMSTTWWAPRLQSADHRRVFAEAVGDVLWVIEQQLKDSPGPNTPAVQEVAPSIPEPNSSTLPTWLQRPGGGKRLTKPSRRLIEAMR